MNDLAVTILLCYAHQDERMVHQLKEHLSALEHTGRIALWDYGNIIPGAEREQEIDKHLDEAQIILLLISSSFLASKYCYKVEMKRAIERHERKEARVIPVILRPVYWKEPPIDKLQPLPDHDRPVLNWPKRDAGFENVVDGIVKVLDHFKVLNLIANLDQLIETVKLRMQPPRRADAIAHSLQQLKIFIPNDVTLADLVVGWRTLSRASKQEEDPIISQRRVTCGELAYIASQFTTDQGNLSLAIKTWRIWADAWHIWADAFEKENEEDVPRQATMANTFTRELMELQEAAANP
jgi:hypothetical protein